MYIRYLWHLFTCIEFSIDSSSSSSDLASIVESITFIFWVSDLGSFFFTDGNTVVQIVAAVKPKNDFEMLFVTYIHYHIFNLHHIYDENSLTS